MKRDAEAFRIDERTVLRPVESRDAEGLFAATEANRSHLREWLPWLDAVLSVEQTREFIRASIERAERTGAFTALIESDEEICGVVGYNSIDSTNRACEIGYWLATAHVGKGLMTRACTLLIEYAFGTLQLNRVNIPAAIGNRRSRAIPERLGFHQEGVIRDAEWLYDHFVDHAIYTLLRADWEKDGGRPQA